MDILQKHTDQFFGTIHHGINRSGKVIYTARGAAVNSDLGLWHDGRKVQQSVNYSAQRKRNMRLLHRVLYR